MFKRDFESHAGFDPYDQMTMASACNRYLRMYCLEENTIASEPFLGWRGRVNHSQAFMERFTWCEHRLRRDAWLALSEDETEHEAMAPSHSHTVADPARSERRRTSEAEAGTCHTVDGYNADTQPIYKFHECFWHRCQTCHPQHTDPHPKLLDRTMEDMRGLVDQKRMLFQSCREVRMREGGS